MTRIYTSPGKYIQGPDALCELGAHAAPLGSKLLAIATETGIERLGAKIERGFADVDASIAGTHLLLAAHDLGLGTTWVGHFDVNAVREAFPETEGYDLIALFPLGYPAEGDAPSPKHLERLPVSELVDWV